MPDNASAFFVGEYDEKILCTLPFYSEMHQQILNLVQTFQGDPLHWLDTGCGTGTLVENAAKRFKNCRFTLCDPSEKMLAIAKIKLKEYRDRMRFALCASQDLEEREAFQVVTAMQAHHYLHKEERIRATQKCFQALKPGGICITFENICFSSEIANTAAESLWIQYLISKGRTREEALQHVSRRGKEYFPITPEEHIEILRKAGFRTAEPLWLSYMQAGFWAVK